VIGFMAFNFTRPAKPTSADLKTKYDQNIFVIHLTSTFQCDLKKMA